MGALPPKLPSTLVHPSNPTPAAADHRKRADAILVAHLAAIRGRADLLFGVLLGFLWVAAVTASWLSSSEASLGIALALTSGVLLTVVPALAILLHRTTVFTRHLITVALMLWSAVLVHATNDWLDTDFLAFGSLALLAWYRDWRLLVTATLTVVAANLFHGLFLPVVAAGAADSFWRALEHTGWVLFESAFLYFAICESLKHLHQLSQHQAELELDRQKARSEVQRQSERLYVKEEELRQAQKMEVVGRLAGGIAHDFNNLLTVIAGYSEALLGFHPPEDASHQGLIEIQKAAVRAASLTRQLLAFSRKQILAPKSLDLNAVVVDMEKMLRRLIGEDVELVTRLHPRLGKVYADPGQVQQVVMNLAINARDAMLEGGTLTIESCPITYAGGVCQAAGDVIAPGPYICLTITDTGTGMDAATQAHIFEPFFTTKELGKGTGLGLATVFGIVRQSGGFLEVTSDPGHGTSFKICLPRSFDAQETLPEDALAARTLRGFGTILLVEDEDSVRSLTKTILQSHGYRVIEARHGKEGLALVEQHPDSLDLVLTDMVMPQMGGRQLAEQLRLVAPSVKVLLMSGYTDDSILRQGLNANDEFFLSKPFSPRELLAKVRAVMDPTLPTLAGGRASC